MAIYGKAISANKVINGVATICPAAGGTSFIQSDLSRTQQLTDLSSLTETTTLDGRYKVGASGGWARPGSDMP